MLDLMGFKQEFISDCRNTLCESGPFDMMIEERKVNKAQRGVLNGLLFRKEGSLCAPTFYVEDFYKAYKEGTPISDLSHEVVEAAVRSMGMADEMAKGSLDIIYDTANLRVRLLNKGRNREYLKGIPHRELGCGFVFIAEAGHGEYGAVITNALLKDFKVTADELFDMAIKNTAEQFPAVLQDLAESATRYPTGCVNLLDSKCGRAPADTGRLRELLDGDFYVLPSSVHELILIAADDQDPKQLADLVRSANRSVVEERDILADDLYICEAGIMKRVSYGGMVPGGMPC